MPRLATFVFVLLLLAASSADAQPSSAFRTMIDQLPDGQRADAAWGDYDGDGDFDLAVTMDTFRTRLDFPAFTSVFRYDGDSTAVADNGSTIFFTLNTYPYAETPAPAIPILNCADAALAWGDYDGDDDLELVVTGRCAGPTPRTIFYDYIGGRLLFSVASDALPGVATGDVARGDLDNDGDLDVVMSGLGEEGTPMAYILENQSEAGAGFVPRSTNLQGLEGGTVDLGDYDADGDLDVLLSGIAQPQRFTTAIYRNDGGTFTQVSTDFAPLAWSSAAWGDYDADGDLDVVVNGGRFSPFYFRGTARLYRNEGGTFVDLGIDLPGGYRGGVAWGDYDADGDLDFAVSGGTSPPGGANLTVARNDGGATFTSVDDLFGVRFGTVHFGDYDADGDLDMISMGRGEFDLPRTDEWRNELNPDNAAPSTPTGLSARREGNAVVFSWEAASDDRTPAPGLTYNLRVGTTPGGNDVVPAMALPSGRRLVPGAGNAGHSLQWPVRLPEGTYYWSVQALDGSDVGSPFTAEQVFSDGTGSADSSTR